LTVRVILPEGASPEVPVAEAQAALRSRAVHLSSVAWRNAMAIRNMGRRQLPLGLVVALLSWVIAYAAAAAATSTDSGLLIALFAVVAAIMLTIAWVISWMVIATSYLDWRPDGRKSVGLRADRTMHPGDHLNRWHRRPAVRRAITLAVLCRGISRRCGGRCP
jgi:hypothetical protein